MCEQCDKYFTEQVQEEPAFSEATDEDMERLGIRMKIYSAMYIHCEEIEVLSVHKTKEGASRIIKNHRARKRYENTKFKKKFPRYANLYTDERFKQSNQWFISEEEVLD